MRERTWLEGSGLLVIVVVTAACVPAEPVVGVLQPLSGVAALYGKSIDQGIEVAINEAERINNLPEDFRLIREDTGSDPARAAARYREVCGNGARLVVGGVITEEALALMPEIEEERVICLSPSVSATGISSKSRYFYRLYPTDDVEGRTAARHLYDDRGVKTVLIFTDGSMYTRGVESEFRQHFQLNLQGKILATVRLDDPHWKRTSTDVLHGFDPDAVYVIGYADRILEALSHIKQTGYDGIRCTTSTFYVSDVLGRAGAVAEEVLFPLSAFDAASLEEPVAGFVEAYSSRFGTEPDIFAAHGYDAMRVAIRAVATADPLYTPEIRKVMSFRMDGLAGVTGTIAFDDHGGVKRYPVMHVVYGGRVMKYSDYKKKKIEEFKQRLLELSGSNGGDTAAVTRRGAA